MRAIARHFDERVDESDPSFATALYHFVTSNKVRLLPDARASYQLEQAANEAFRFAQHPALLPLVRSMIADALAHSTMAWARSRDLAERRRGRPSL